MQKRILVIDDDQDILEILSEMLDYWGFKVKTLLSSVTIFDDIAEFKPDLVLMDYILSGINGGEICHQIKTNKVTKSLPVILISAYPRVLQSLGSYSSDDFVAKPFDIDDLLASINTCINPLRPNVH